MGADGRRDPGLGGAWSTLILQRTLTELAYLRDAEVKGVIDTAGQHRATELLYQARSLRGLAIDDPRGQRLKPAPIPQAEAR